jgi:rhamnogalacturonan endolyase
MIRIAVSLVFFTAIAGFVAVAHAAQIADAPVTLSEDATSFTLSNGVITAVIVKQNGDLGSLKHNGLELLGGGAGRSDGYWSLPGTTLNFGHDVIPSIRENPAGNNGERAVVSCRFTYDNQPGTVPADVELCYALARGDTALYLYANWEHKASYPNLSFPVGRFAMKLNPDFFDYMAIDDHRKRVMPTAADWGAGVAQNMKEARRLTTGKYAGQVEHKYDYSAVQYDTPAYGWASDSKHVGVWMVTASNEYMSGGCTKLELNSHLDGNQSGFPTLLNVWKGPHYGGSVLSVPKGESWSKCIGPFLVYCNSGETGEAMWKDAMAKAASAAKAWPFDWVKEPAFYTPREERAMVTGRIQMVDPVIKQTQIGHLMVGLSAPDWKINGNGATVDWQQDGKFYQYWTESRAVESFRDLGFFMIPNVRPGAYTLHAFATGVLGEFAKADVKVEAGKPLDLGTLEWKPVRYGTQVWEIGYPDRTAGKYFHGDHYWQWGIYNQYPKDFPHDVNFIMGQSDYRKDWNLMQVPRGHDDTGKGRGDATTWSVTFDLPPVPTAPTGRGTLRIALAGTEARSLAVAMNDQSIGSLTNLPNTMAIHRDSDRGYWEERGLMFDAGLMRAGKNVLKLTVPAGSVTAGIEYDYLRLELDEHAQSPPVGQNELRLNSGSAAGAGQGGED